MNNGPEFEPFTADMTDDPDIRPVFRGDLDIRIDRDGTWHYHGSPISRKEMVCLFASVLFREDDGAYILTTPTECGFVTVEDMPFIAVQMYCKGCGPDAVLSFRTNVDEIVTVDVLHPLTLEPMPDGGDPVPCVTVRDGLMARLSRSVYYDLVKRAQDSVVQGAPRLGVWSCGMFFPLEND